MKLPLQLDELKAQLEVAKRDAEDVTAGLSDAQFWQRPPSGGWSVGECLAHLNLVGEPYALKVAAALRQARARGRTATGPFAFGWLGGRFVRSLSAEAKTTFRAPKGWQPERQVDVLGRFLRLQDTLEGLVVDAEGLAVAHVGLASPATPLVRLSVFEALNLLVVHEQRHLRQAERVRTAGQG